MYGTEKDNIFKAHLKPCDEDISMFSEKDKYSCIIEFCEGENNRSFHLKNSIICLHAWKYHFNDSCYEAQWPDWTDLNYSFER